MLYFHVKNHIKKHKEFILKYMFSLPWLGMWWLLATAQCNWCNSWSLVVWKACEHDLLPQDPGALSVEEKPRQGAAQSVLHKEGDDYYVFLIIHQQSKVGLYSFIKFSLFYTALYFVCGHVRSAESPRILSLRLILFLNDHFFIGRTLFFKNQMCWVFLINIF